MTHETETANNNRGEGPTLEVPEVVPLHTSRALVVMDDLDRRILADVALLVGQDSADALWASLDQGQGRRWVWYAFMLARLSLGTYTTDPVAALAYAKAISLLAIVSGK